MPRAISDARLYKVIAQYPGRDVHQLRLLLMGGGDAPSKTALNQRLYGRRDWFRWERAQGERRVWFVRATDDANAGLKQRASGAPDDATLFRQLQFALGRADRA